MIGIITGRRGFSVLPANARALLLPPSGRGVLLGDGTFSLPVMGTARHRAALDKLSGGQPMRCAALLTRDGREYDPRGVMVTIKGQEVGFLLWMDGHDFRDRLRQAGFLEAVCKLEVTGNHRVGDGWDLVGATIDATLPFAFMSPDEWHRRHTQDNESVAPRLHSSNSNTLSALLKALKQSIVLRARRAISGGRSGVVFHNVNKEREPVGEALSRQRRNALPEEEEAGGSRA
jgi:hypothetical protein